MEQFKKARVIMLPTKNRPCLLNLTLSNNLHLWNTNGTTYNPNGQHLYIILNDEIKEGDYYLFFKNNSICRAEFLTEENIEVLEGLRKIKAVQKIIASTDTLLIEDKRTYICGLMDKPNILPQPSQQFIKKYIDSYNLSEVNSNNMTIIEVLVEYELLEDASQSIDMTDGVFIPKINFEDNTITIKKLKDSWSREEMIKNIKSFADVFVANTNTACKQFDIDNWIKENL
jgi:hypothetical protein